MPKSTFTGPTQLQESPAERNLSQRVDAAIDSFVGAGTIVGTVVTIFEDGRQIYQRAAGLADREIGRPMREDAIFRMASLTKPIVSATALALVERKLLGLDDLVTDHLPEFAPRTADGVVQPITIRHLLTHTAGLSYRFLEPAGGPYERAGVSDGMDQPGLPMSENLQRIATVPLTNRPGEAWTYSVATDVLGAVIERSGGKALAEIVDQFVLRPLGMADTGFAVTDRNRLAVPYGDASPLPVRMGTHHLVPFFDGHISFAPDRIHDPNSFQSGGAGMVGSASDFVRFLEAIRLGGVPILTTSSVTELASVSTGDLFVDAAGPGWGFGLASSVLIDPSVAVTPQSRGTLQWGGAYGHSWFVDRVRRLTVLIMSNTATAGMLGPYPTAVRDAVYDFQAPSALG